MVKISEHCQMFSLQDDGMFFFCQVCYKVCSLVDESVESHKRKKEHIKNELVC